MIRIVSVSHVPGVSGFSGGAAGRPLAATAPEASSNTWGIAGPAFLVGFTIATIVVVGGTALALGLIAHARSGGADAVWAEPTPTQLGLASGGEALALAVALADLRQRSLLGHDAAPLRRGNAVRAELTGLARAVHDAMTLRAVPGSITRLQADPQVGDELDRTRDEVRALGLVLSPARRRAQAWCALGPVILLVVGIARVIAGRGNGKPVGALILLVVIVFMACVGLVRNARKRHLTARGRMVLEQLRRDNRHLTPRLQPSWPTYGPTSLLLGTALFGGVALFSADPVFAEAVGARTVPAAGQMQSSGAAGAGSGCSSGSSCSGGSSCGGGGCGGGCGG